MVLFLLLSLQGRTPWGSKPSCSRTLHVILFLLLSLQGSTPQDSKPLNSLQSCLFIRHQLYSLVDKEYINSLTRNRLSLHTKEQSILPRTHLFFYTKETKNNLIGFPSPSRKLNQFSNSLQEFETLSQQMQLPKSIHLYYKCKCSQEMVLQVQLSTLAITMIMSTRALQSYPLSLKEISSHYKKICFQCHLLLMLKNKSCCKKYFLRQLKGFRVVMQ